MAWQTPKTDWSSEDGVRDIDLNRMEGNILELYNGASAVVDTTLYVSTSGSDTSGTGAYGAPYRTINKALSAVPKNLNGKAVSISIATGTYNESISVKGFTSPIILTGPYNGRVTVNDFSVDGCVCILDTIYILLADSEVTVTNGGVLTGTGSLSVGNAPNSLVVNRCSRVSLTNLISEGAANYAIIADGASHVYVTNLSGMDNAEGVLVQGGSIVAVSSNTLDYMGDMVVSYSGGRFYTGSQNFASNVVAEAEVV